MLVVVYGSWLFVWRKRGCKEITMQTKLTLRLDEELIRQAKSYAEKRGKSVSRIVADYFVLLNRASIPEGEGGTPVVRSLRGVLRGATVDEGDYHDHLEEKYL